MKNTILVNSIEEYVKAIYDITQEDEETINDIYIKNIYGLMSEYNILSNYFSELIKSLQENKQQIQNDKKKNKVQKYKFFYRGHYNKKDYKLVPSVFRGKNWAKEDYYYHEMIVRCADLFQNSTHLDRLVRMQHYGCPTRLLDITTNPLVALYFACENFGCKKCNTANQGEVIIFAVQDKQISYFDSDKALMLSCLSRFDKQQKVLMHKEANTNLKEFQTNMDGSAYKNEHIEKLYHEISTEVPSFKRKIIPKDLITPIFIQPEKTNNRIVKQDGAFILCGLSRNERQSRAKVEALRYKRIIINDQEKIKKELEALGINKATLFPEVDMVAEYLKECVQRAENQ